jgi:hypothetical protein
MDRTVRVPWDVLLHRAGAGARRGFLVAEGFVRALVDGGCGAGRSRGCGTSSRLDAFTQPSLPSAIVRTRYRAPAVRRGRHAVISTSTPSASVARVTVPSSPVTGTRLKPSPRLRTIARTPTARTVPFDGRDGSWENRRDAKPVGTGTDTSGKRPRSGANRIEAFPCGGEVAPDRATAPRPPNNPEPQYARPGWRSNASGPDGISGWRPGSAIRRCGQPVRGERRLPARPARAPEHRWRRVKPAANRP